MRRFFYALGRILSAPFRFVGWLFRRLFGLVAGTVHRVHFFFNQEPEDTPVADAFSKAVDNPQDLLFHLDALRKHLLRAVLVLIATTVFSFIFTRQILDILARPLGGGLELLEAVDVTEPIGVFMRVALLTGFALALPYIILELWLFAAPGLSRRARVWGLAAIPTVTLFFLAGMAFAYFVFLPTALPFLVNFMGFRTSPRPATYFPFVTGIMFWVGISFEFPLVMYLLAAMGLVTGSALLKQTRLAVVVLAIVAAAITPTIDPISMLLVWVPLVLLYLLGVGLAFLAQGQRAGKESDSPTTLESNLP